MTTDTTSGGQKPLLRNQSELPAYSYPLSAPPSQLLDAPIEALLDLADAIRANDAATQARFEIRDEALREAMVSRRLHAAVLRGDIAATQELAAALRGLQSRDDQRLTAGLIAEILVEAWASPDPAATAGALAEARLAALPAALVLPWFRQQRATLKAMSASFARGLAAAELDKAFAAHHGALPHQPAALLVDLGFLLHRQIPLAGPLADAFDRQVKAHASADGVDIWPARDVQLTPDLPGTPVVIGIWDTGVDPDLITPAADPGLAIDHLGHQSPHLIRPAGEFADRIEDLLTMVKGSMDLRAGVETAEADAFQSRMRGLDPASWQAFAEAMGFMTHYAHGTPVACTAIEGNPFARVQVVAFHAAVRRADKRMDRDISARRQAFYAEAVERLRAAGARVVNMSWGLTQAEIADLIEAGGEVPDPEARQALARELFLAEREVLHAAILGAPEILFVAAAGNDGADAGFAEILPSTLSAPNLITVGAVDKAGREALFTSFGDTVVLYANGVEVMSRLPGGRALAGLSGTSMASPQVANAAAKLFAMKPSLSATDVRRLLVETGEMVGRCRLLDTRAAFAAAGIDFA